MTWQDVPCQIWVGAKNPKGYGSKKGHNGKTASVHRLAYEAQYGPIPKELQVDHLCRNRACFEVAHMELVTNRENSLRGIGPTARNARRTHCPSGHPYDLFNTRIHNNKRYCRQCQFLVNRREFSPPALSASGKPGGGPHHRPALSEAK